MVYQKTIVAFEQTLVSLVIPFVSFVFNFKSFKHKGNEGEAQRAQRKKQLNSCLIHQYSFLSCLSPWFISTLHQPHLRPGAVLPV
jgi:hypothetical protein